MTPETKIKVPIGLNCTVEQAKLYAQFLDFKLYNPQGVLTPKLYGALKTNRVKNRYWLEKLVVAGWATKSKSNYHLKSYTFVAKSLGLSEYFIKGRLMVPYFKVNPDKLALDKKVYIKQLIDLLLKRTVENKRRQMLHAQKTHANTQNRFESYGVRSAADLFGYRSPKTGLKYRNKYFSVVKSGGKPMRTNNLQFSKYSAEFIYKCDKVAL